MNKFARILASAVALVVLLVALIPVAAFASVKGRRNTAYGLSALTLYQLVRGRPGTALVVGAGAAYAWKRYYDTKEKRYKYRKVPIRR